jgi:hypothetical protein
VDIEFKRAPLVLVPGSAEPLQPDSPLAALNARLSLGTIAVGEITYPDTVDYPAELGLPQYRSKKGTLILAKASIIADSPYELLSYSLQNAAFPRDSTGDQWFDSAQFDAISASWTNPR